MVLGWPPSQAPRSTALRQVGQEPKNNCAESNVGTEHAMGSEKKVVDAGFFYSSPSTRVAVPKCSMNRRGDTKQISAMPSLRSSISVWSTETVIE